MSHKIFRFDEQTMLTIYKRKASRSLRLSITADGQVRVSIPTWAPYSAGLQFARARQPWIIAQRRPVRQLRSGQAIGKAHHLRFLPIANSTKVAGRVSANEIVIKHPAALSTNNATVQHTAELTSIRALRVQAEQLLPQRIASLANQYDFHYASVNIKRLKSRWGSCDARGDIVLNLFLMQLPWEYIDYVLLHELAHTRVLRHGPDFWQVMTGLVPNVGAVRKALRSYQPVLQRPL